MKLFSHLPLPRFVQITFDGFANPILGDVAATSLAAAVPPNSLYPATTY